MRVFVLVSVLALFSFGLFSCKKGNPIPPEQQPQISLTLEDVSCTEAWLKLTTANITLPADVELLKDDIHSETISLTSADTILYIDSLLPNKTYNLTSFIQSNNQSINASVPVSTMDTTSHNFTFQTWTFGGEAGSCELRDVVIINPNNIWAVGDINIADTSINGYTTYNAVHWDGTQWKLKRIRYFGNCSAVEYPPLCAIWSFSNTNIVLTNGGSIGWFDGNAVNLDCGVKPILEGAINKIWGTSSNDLYVVGNSGSSAHYQNGQWTKIETGTDAKIADIWGTSISSSNQSKIYCSVPSGLEPSKRRILTINDNNVDSIHWNGKIATSCWTTTGKIIYTSGDGIYNNKTGNWAVESTLPGSYTYRIRGNNLNDIFVCGNYGFLAHYNGVSWKVSTELLQLNGSALYSLSVKDNIIVTVGFDGDKALIVVGKRM